MQFPGGAKAPVGIVFDAAMRRIDDVLALAMLHGLEGKDQARIAAVAVNSGDMKAAQFCDAVARFYASATTGQAAMFMHAAPIGLADGKPAAASPVFAKVSYASSIRSVEDTADPATLIRNSLMAQHDQDAAVVLSGPATDLVRLLDMYGVKDWIARKVRLLCVAETDAQADAAATQKVMADWPSPVVTVGPKIGEALAFPGASIDQDFAYASDHPIAAAYRTYRQMPYDAPSSSMAAVLYAAHPNDGYFKLSGSGTRRELVFDPEQKDRILKIYVELASAKPVPRKPRRPPDAKKDEKKVDQKAGQTDEKK